MRDEQQTTPFARSELTSPAGLQGLQGPLQPVKRIHRISVGLDQDQSLQEGVRGAESPVLQPGRALAQCPPRLPFRVPWRLKAALSPPVLAADFQIFPYTSKDLWGKEPFDSAAE